MITQLMLDRLQINVVLPGVIKSVRHAEEMWQKKN